MQKASYQEANLDLYEESFWKINTKLKELGITDVFDSSNSVSDKSSSDFLLALRNTKDWIENKASLYARENKKLKDLDSLLKYDPLTEWAARFKWRGMYKPEESSEFYSVYLRFEADWRAEKISKFVELVDAYKRPRRSWKPFAAAVGGLSLLVAGAFASYEFYLKPDIKNEIQKSVPVFDIDSALDSAISKMRPELRKELEQYRGEVRKELESYNAQSEENIERAVEKILKKYNLDSLLKMLGEGK